MASVKSKEGRAAAKAEKPAASSSVSAATERAAAGKPARAVAEETGVKHFVLDTNVLLHNPNALFVFKEHHVVIPFTVIEELDKLKRQNDDIGRNARECIRHLDRLRSQGRLTEGVKWGQFSPVAGQASSAGGGNGKAATGPYTSKKTGGFGPPPLSYEYRLYKIDSVPQNNPMNPKYRAFIALWKRLPIGVANRLGPHIVRNLG